MSGRIEQISKFSNTSAFVAWRVVPLLYCFTKRERRHPKKPSLRWLFGVGFWRLGFWSRGGIYENNVAFR